MIYKLEAFTYEGSIMCQNLDTEEPWLAREMYFRSLESAEREIRRIVTSEDIDDSYLTLTGDGPYVECHEHPRVSRVLPLTVELPDEKVTELKRGLEMYLDEEKRMEKCDEELPF